MAKIQIKRYNSTSQEWENQFPITKAQHIVANNGTTPIFDANDKLNPIHLPNAIFDNLQFVGTLSANTDIRTLAANAITGDATTLGRNAKGMYWVATAKISLSGGAAINTGSPAIWVSAGLNPSEEGNSSGTGTSIEIGDWIVITNITGSGTSGDAFSVTFAVVNNTYELADVGVNGIVSLSNQTSFNDLAGNAVITEGLFQTLVNSHIQPQVTALQGRVRVFYDGTPTGMMMNDLWFDAV